MLRQLEDISRGNVSERELERAKNRVQSSHVFQLERFGGFGGRADQLNYYNVMDRRPAVHNQDIDRYVAVTRDDVARVAGTLSAPGCVWLFNRRSSARPWPRP